MGNQCCKGNTADAQAKKGQLYQKPSLKTRRDDRAQNDQLQENITFVQNVPLFSRLEPSAVPLIAQALDVRSWQPGENVITEGEAGDEFFLIKEGDL